MARFVFLATCVLACDFMIFMFFQWTLGEKYRGRRRRIAARKRTAQAEASRPYLVNPRPNRAAHANERQIA
jgi:hypothetical protein